MITHYYGDKILEYVIGASSSITGGTGKCYFALSSTEPTAVAPSAGAKPTAENQNFTEPDPETYPSYARVQLNIKEATLYTNKWGDVSNGTVSNNAEFTTPECLEEDGWPTFTHFGIFDAETDGNLLMFDELTDPDGEPDENGKYPAKELTVKHNHVAVFRKDTLTLKFT